MNINSIATGNMLAYIHSIKNNDTTVGSV